MSYLDIENHLILIDIFLGFLYKLIFNFYTLLNRHN